MSRDGALNIKFLNIHRKAKVRQDKNRSLGGKSDPNCEFF
jgi:hypothetical protein